MRRTPFPILMVAVFALAACADQATVTTSLPPPTGAGAGSTTAGTGFPVTIEAGNHPATIPARPEAIVSLSATATEMLFAIGAGGQVVAVDEFSDFPPEAPTTELSGFTPNVEAIASYAPDLVVVAFDPEGLVTALEELGIPVIHHDAARTLDDTYAQIEQLGAATGHVAESASLVAEMQTAIDDMVAGLPSATAGSTYYHELDDTLVSATSATFIGELYSLLGLVNIADGSDPDGFGYPQLSPEVVLDADPDYIFLADTVCCGQSRATVAARPGWESLEAVASGRVVELDDAVASRWGPRVVDFLKTVTEAVAAGAPVG